MKDPFFFLRWCPEDTIFGIRVFCFFCCKEDQAVLFPRIEEALCLIQEYDPRRFAQIQQDVHRILVRNIGSNAVGRWNNEARMIMIDQTYLEAEETSVALVASVLVHEANHARLFRLGFGYEEPQRVQVERICFKSERAFARRLPNNAALIEGLNTEIFSICGEQGKESLSDAAREEAEIEYIRQREWPRWLINLMLRLRSYLVAKRLKRLEDEKKRIAGKG